MDGESDIVIEKTGKNEKIFIKVPVKYGKLAFCPSAASLLDALQRNCTSDDEKKVF